LIGNGDLKTSTHAATTTHSKNDGGNGTNYTYYLAYSCNHERHMAENFLVIVDAFQTWWKENLML
jgi:hypothetical protein